MTVTLPLTSPPAPIQSAKTYSKLELLDIDTMELARQITIMASCMYQKVKPMECLRRLREATMDYEDNITAINRYSDRVGLA
jgi:son of sevenless